MNQIHFSQNETSIMLFSLDHYYHHQTKLGQKNIKRQLSSLIAQIQGHHKIMYFELSLDNAPIILRALRYMQHADNISQLLSSNNVKALKSVIHKVSHYYHLNKALSVTPHQLITELNHDAHIAKHSFIKEALNDIFKGLKINSKKRTARYTTILSNIASGVACNHEFDSNEHHDKKFFVNQLVLVGLLNAMDDKHNSVHKRQSAKYMYKRFHELYAHGHQYVVGTTIYKNHEPVKYVISPVHLDECLAVINVIKKVIKDEENGSTYQQAISDNNL